MITELFEVMPYEEWILLNPDVAQSEEMCDECNGMGEIECSHCGNVSECSECVGTGKKNSSRQAYMLQMERDKKVLDRYIKSLSVIH